MYGDQLNRAHKRRTSDVRPEGVQMYWSWLRLAAAAAALSGVLAGYIVNVDRATRQGQDLGLVLANYFSLFTIVSTILTIVALTAAAIWSMAHPGHVTRAVRRSRSASAWSPGPVLLLGVVFNVLLRGAPSGRRAERLRRDRPAGLVRDRDAARRAAAVPPRRPDLRDAATRPARGGVSPCLAGYPLMWMLYTMVRGELTPDPSGAATLVVPLPVPRSARSPAGRARS